MPRDTARHPADQAGGGNIRVALGALGRVERRGRWDQGMQALNEGLTIDD
jgi:hypothetical protein